MDSHHWRLIEQTKHRQDELKVRRENATQVAKRTARAKLLAESAVDSGSNPFDGSVDKCTICLDEFRAGDLVCRLLCRHVFYEACLTAFLMSSTFANPCCPECRGPTYDPKAYVYIAESQFVVADSSGDEGTRDRNRDHLNDHHSVLGKQKTLQEVLRTSVSVLLQTGLM
jgi:hypothetical protein